MKNIFVVLFLTLLPVAGMAQRDVAVSDLRIVQQPSVVAVAFSLKTGTGAARTGSTLTLKPVLVNGDQSLVLTPVVVRGRRAAILAHRGEIAAGRDASQETVSIRNGENMEYRTTIPFEDWMPGAKLILKGEGEGCGVTSQTLIGTLADSVIVPASEFTSTQTVVIPGRILSTADKLVQHFPFLHPAGDSALDAPPSSRTSRQEGGLTIFFTQGQDSVVPDYRENYRSLVDLLSVIEEIRRSADSEIDRIDITGFASPEGDHDANVRLSERRAEAMRRVIAQNSPELATLISVYAGGEDWDGLRELVCASQLPRRDEVLRAIDRKNKEELMRLEGGEVYRSMERTLFPELREATFIIVYYKNKR